MSTWDSFLRAWTGVRQGWDAGWRALADRATRELGPRITADIAAYVPQVEAFLGALRDARTHLDAAAALLPSPPRDEADRRSLATWKALDQRYLDLSAGFYADASPAPGMGAAPLLVVGGLLIGVAGVAWAVVTYEYAVNLREQTALQLAELRAREAASKEGRALQDSTLADPKRDPNTPKDPPDDDDGPGLGWLIAGGLALAGGVFLLPRLSKRG